MTPRPLDLLDLPILYRHRSEALSLDATRLLTRGNPLGAMGFMPYFNPARHIYSAINHEDGISMVGGVTHTKEESIARLLYLAPLPALTHPGLSALIENLTVQAANWGAYHLLAEVDETSDVFPAMRSAGFSVYAWQRIWNLSEVPIGENATIWAKADPLRLTAIQSLYHYIVPPLLQPIEPTPRQVSGLVYIEGARGYATITSGLRGIIITPLIHPETANVPQLLTGLLQTLTRRRNRPVYLCVRSYQAWLEPALEDLGAKASPRQAVMVKHLARLIKEEQNVRAAQPATAIPASQITHVQTKQQEK